ncbi:hypothetical protein JL108_05460 [Aeromicrobium sp. YIM 150415]|uniref:hypothetical protein n=1 Tax=Aeromicrobium sp. YIM 150415 TaxID=2803912 RepID=UPI0019650B1E|nr:hypothetical protein [Aeromicrobium sp. YIM 150415]MBM9462889.1 hypothetical protein [Aeromicrobium sp. YIM 150415]
MIRRLILALALVATSLATSVVTSVDSASAADCDTGGIGGGVSVGCEEGGGGGDRGPDPIGGTPIWVDPKEYRWVVACDVNGPENPDDALCGSAIAPCPDRQIQYRLYSRERGSDEPWQFERLQCRGADTPDPNEPITIDDILDEIVQLAPKPEITVEPEARTYVNIPTNVATGDETYGPFVVPMEDLPIEVSVSFTPSDITWSFGDGSGGSGAGIVGAAIGEAGAVEHEYRRAGAYSITVTRDYTATVTVDGEPIDADVPITNTSDPYPITVGEVQSLVKRVR